MIKQEVKNMPLIKVKKHSQITIPNEIRRKFKIAEGDYLEIEEHNNELILKPVKMIHSDEAYFHTQEWQAGEREADKDIAAGNVIGPFENIKDALKALKTTKA
jgi:AbrB family looped-hinge helix DNA binding protein